MKLRELINRCASNIQTWSRAKILIVSAVLLIGVYGLVYLLPRQVVFSYSSVATCVGQLTLAPGVQRSSDAAYSISYRGGFSIGGQQILATSLCFTPSTPPRAGVTRLAVAPWGLPVFSTPYHITVDAQPKVLAAKLSGPIAVSKPVAYQLNQTDKVFEYRLVSATSSTKCRVAETMIACDLKPLALEQGATHMVTLQRQFKANPAQKIRTDTLAILPAVAIVDSSVKSGAVVYDKPTTFSFAADKKLTTAKLKLSLKDGERAQDIPIATRIDGTTIVGELKTDLAREKPYVLTLESATAEDGSTLSEPHIIEFSTSGGPKVSAVSIGSAGVDPNAKVVITLDQALADTVDITKFAQVNGVAGAVSKQGNQVIVSLNNAPRCASFTLSLEKGLTSATNGMTSTAPWSFASRINCKATSIIGYSVKGRPIVAYYYGSGATTILFTGGMHGSEPSGATTMQAWAAHLDTYAYKIPADRQVVIVPNTNPDGIAANSRFNANGINLDRNYATADWTTDIDTSTGRVPGGGGPAPMSEPETKALAALTASVNPRLEVSFHAQGRLVGANDYGDSRTIGNMYAATVGYRTMFGGNADETMGYTLSGQYEDWIAQKLGKPAILIELPSPSGNYFSSQQTALWQMVGV